MTIPTDDLRAQLARELDDLGPAPDLAAGAATRGAASLRRRRVIAGAALGVVAVGGGTVAAGLLAADDSVRPRQDDLPVANDETSAPTLPTWDPLADGHVTEREWNRTVSEALTAALPERYGAVAPVDSDFDVQMFGTEGGDPRLQMAVHAAGWLRASEDPHGYRRDKSCAAIDRSRELYSCHQAEFGDGWFAVVTTDLLPPGNGGPYGENERVEIPPYDPDNIPEDWSFGTVLTVMNEGVQIELNPSELGWDEISGNDPAGITDAELLAAAQTPEFLRMVEVAVQWWYDEPDPEPLIIDGEEIPPLGNFKKQQIPPTFP